MSEQEKNVYICLYLGHKRIRFIEKRLQIKLGGVGDNQSTRTTPFRWIDQFLLNGESKFNQLVEFIKVWACYMIIVRHFNEIWNQHNPHVFDTKGMRCRLSRVSSLQSWVIFINFITIIPLQHITEASPAAAGKTWTILHFFLSPSTKSVYCGIEME